MRGLTLAEAAHASRAPLLPARAGMNRTDHLICPSAVSTPRPRGDNPIADWIGRACEIPPAHAGIIPFVLSVAPWKLAAPRPRGDDPSAELTAAGPTQESDSGRPGENGASTPSKSSPPL